MLSYFQFEIVRTFSLLWLLRSQQCRQGLKAAPLPMLPTHGGNWTFCYESEGCPGAIAGLSQSDTQTTPFKNRTSASTGLPILLANSPLLSSPSLSCLHLYKHSVCRSYHSTDFGINRKATLTSCHWCWEKTLIYLNFLQDRYFQSSIVKGKLQLYTEPKITR